MTEFDFSGIPDQVLRINAEITEQAMLAQEDLDKRVLLGDALEMVLDEIFRRIGDVDWSQVDRVHSQHESFTKALFAVHPEFGRLTE
jgi:hypothetical protein